MSDRGRLKERIKDIKESVSGADPSCDASTLERAKATVSTQKMSEYARKAVEAWLEDWARLEKKMAECADEPAQKDAVNREQLHAWLDSEMSVVAEEAKALTPDMDEIERAGTISGMLMKSALALAHKHGAPRAIVEQSIAETLDDLYGQP